MKNAMALILCLSWMNAFAGYQCELNLSDSEDPETIVASKIIEASGKEMGSRNVENFFTEFKMGEESIGLKANIFMSGWAGEEEVSVSFSRRVKVANDSELNKISEKISLRGSAESELWFDHYKLDISCSLT